MLELHPGKVTLPTGFHVAYERCGEGETVVLLHGIGHSTKAWRRVMLPLAERYDVVALDLLGCGRSDKPDTDYSLGAQAAAVRHTLDMLRVGTATMVGHSLGGGVAMTYSYTYPERVDRLGLVASAGLGRQLHPLFRAATLPVAPEHVMRVALGGATRLPRRALFSATHGWPAAPFFAHPEWHREEVDDLLEGLEDEGARRAFLAMLRSASNLSGQAISALDRIGAATMPLLLVWGRDDRIFPLRHAQRAAGLVPHARLVVLDDCGHFPQIERAPAFLAALDDWLATTTPAPVDVDALVAAADSASE